MMNFELSVPAEFSFEQCFSFLKRSPKELLHQCGELSVRKLIRIDNTPVLFEVRPAKGLKLAVQVLNTRISAVQKKAITLFIKEWFDLETDLKPFYRLGRKDQLLKGLVDEHFGYRIVGQPDLFESLVWAVIGQQINLQFAYTLKAKFVEKYGDQVEFDATNYYLFPTPRRVSSLNEGELLSLQFSRQKAKYISLIAAAFEKGEISKASLQGLSLSDVKERLVTIKGVGNWTANYAIMKTFRLPDAFPVEDVGLHNAIRAMMNLDRKPTIAEVKTIFEKYAGWEAYATLYLWRSL
jgi:DNA-3-methyladenine glycosylase II